MEIGVISFSPPEAISHRQDGTRDNLSTILLRRFALGAHLRNTFPIPKRFSEGDYTLTNEGTHTIKLIVAEDSAEIRVERRLRGHHKRNRVVVDWEGNIISLDKIKLGEDTEKGEYPKVGIARRFSDNTLAVEWYLLTPEAVDK